MRKRTVVTVSLKIGTMICGVALILVYLATFFNWVPMLSSVANYATIGFVSITQPIVLALVAFCVSIAIWQRKSLYFRIAAGLSLIGLVMAIIAMASVRITVESAGAETHPLDVYTVGEPQDIISQDFVYDTEGGEETSLTVFGSGGNLLDTLGLEIKTSQSGKKTIVSKDGSENIDMKAALARAENAERIPIVVYIHGGGWIENDRFFRVEQCKSFAEEGYLSITVDYTLSTENKHLAVDCATEKQLLKAFAWIAQYAPAFGGDLSRLYVMGDSAGGNLALDIAYKINGGVYKEADGVELPKVTAVSVTYPVASPKTFYENDDPVFSDEAKKMATWYTGATPEENAKVYDEITPANFITNAAPPTFIMVGEHDTLVPPQATYDLASSLESAGIKCKLVKVPFANHTMDVPVGNTVCQAYWQLAHKWFEENR